MELGVEWAKGFLQAALGMFPVIWIAFAVLPQGTFPGASKATPIAGGPVRQGIIALRPVAELMPLMIYMLGGENNIRYLIGYYQAAVIIQHSDLSTSRVLAIPPRQAPVFRSSTIFRMIRSGPTRSSIPDRGAARCFKKRFNSASPFDPTGTRSALIKRMIELPLDLRTHPVNP